MGTPIDGIYLKRSRGGPYENVTVMVSIGVNDDGYHDGHVLIGASPAPLEVDPVDAGVGAGTLEWPVPPLLDRRPEPLPLRRRRRLPPAHGRLQNRAAAHRRRLYDRSGDDAERRRPVRDY